MAASRVMPAVWQQYGSSMTALWQHYGSIMAQSFALTHEVTDSLQKLLEPPLETPPGAAAQEESLERTNLLIWTDDFRYFSIFECRSASVTPVVS